MGETVRRGPTMTMMIGGSAEAARMSSIASSVRVSAYWV
jgi:hypothetical protein